MAVDRLSFSYNRHGKWLRLGFNFDEWLGGSPTRNPTKFSAKYRGYGCRICSLSERQEDKIKKSASIADFLLV